MHNLFKVEYKRSKQADNDLIDIYLYGYHNFGEQQAEHYFSQLEKCFHLLSQSPLMCWERKEFTPHVRIHHHKHHLIVYIIQGTTILIIRILHDSMDVQRHINH